MLVSRTTTAVARWIGLLIFSLTSMGYSQTTWHVDSSGTAPGSGTMVDPYTSVEFAVAQATTLDGDRIEVVPGIYSDELVDFLGKAVVVESVGGSAVTFLVGRPATQNQTYPVVRFDNAEGPGSQLIGFTIEGGSGVPGIITTTVPPRPAGGGIFCRGASPVLTDLVLTGNECLFGHGSGIYLESSSAAISGCAFVDNGPAQITSSSAGFNSFGGGAYLVGCDVDFVDTVWDSNSATEGGALFSTGSSVSFVDCEVLDNSAACSGGLRLEFGWVVTRNSRFSGNAAAANGASALDVRDASSALIENCAIETNSTWGSVSPVACYVVGGLVDVVDCSFVSNKGNGLSVDSSMGSAVSNCRFEGQVQGVGMSSEGPLQVLGCGFVGNEKGGLRVFNGDGVISQCEFVGNSAIRGGGIRFFYPVGTFLVEGSLFSGNTTVPNDSGGAVYVENSGSAVTLDRCTLVNNSAPANRASAADRANLVNCIAWENRAPVGPQRQFEDCTVTYSIAQGGAPGQGNLDVNPFFWDYNGEDFRLLPSSPAVDSGDPQSAFDPDGSRADRGAFPYDVGYCGALCASSLGSSYCSATANSTGLSAVIRGFGSSEVSANAVALFVDDLPVDQPGYFLTSMNQAFVPLFGGSQGNLCLGASIVRVNQYVLTANAAGTVALSLDLTDLPRQTQFVPGETWNFQYWFRDNNPSLTSNTSQGLSVLWD